ncbi:MAG: diadenylate cyclase CdaA [Anaerolineales bacterium]|nr:diadenylate cyclase CdaA [Anaerolineales bacterium]MCB0006593.1 diadenylate cyclase CdaA [Anaerolineales bacterium]MCB0013183.1 diadenylate cyclase CdaA [Anaerolineales bacterium]MCB0017441.1 diadenylate cyclase CdaA [Anaerolineales bacterium]MCB8959838.1 TIGR00159 family protein [Ardenticatenales bacterium]
MLEAILEQIPFYIDRLNAAAFADILLVTAIIFVMLIVIRGTRAVQLLRGLLIIVALVALATSFIDLPAFNLVFQTIFPALLVAFPVLFQPELRRALDKAGRTGQFLRFFRRNERSPMLDAIGNACLHLSQRRHGALIVIEQETGLQEYVDTGILLDAEPSPELFLTIFNKNTELHDGAVIVRGEKIVAAACVMPLSTSSLSDRQLGLRHRAGLGLSEVSDAIVVIVSEETGRITIAHNGRLIRRQDPNRLSDILHAFINNRRNQPDDGPVVAAAE